MAIEGLMLIIHRIYKFMHSGSPIRREAILIIIHNTFLLYYIINWFKHLAQASINSPGPVNTFYYIPLVYEAPAIPGTNQNWNVVLKTSNWQFFESLFRHNLALMFPFSLVIMVSSYKILFMSTLVSLLNLLMLICFTSSICQLLVLNGLTHSIQLALIFGLGPVIQLVLVCRLLDITWVDAFMQFDWNFF